MRSHATRTVLVVAAAIAAAGSTNAAQFGGLGPRTDLEVVEQFDQDGNGWLDRTEREAARAFVVSRGGPRGRGGGRGFAAAPGSPGPRVSPHEVPPAPASVPFYAPEVLRTLFVEFETDDWEQELALFKDTDVEVPATVVVVGRRFESVGMSFRGNSSFMMVPEGLKRSFNVTLDLVVDDQNVLGYRTLNLLNGMNDPSLLRGVLFQQIANEYLPAARANFVRVVINGESWGIYQNVEQINRDFVERRFAGENGVRWKVPGSPRARAGLEYLGEDPDAYRALFEIKNKDNERSWEALVHLTRVLNTTPVEQLEAALTPILDIDQVLRFLALDVVLVNSDGYWTRGSDYYLYLDESGRFHVLPGDTNETFSAGGGRGGGGRRGGFGRGAGGPQADVLVGRRGPSAQGSGATLDLLVSIDDATKPLRSRLLAVPALRERYLAYCREIADTWLDWERLGPIARRYQALIAPHVEVDTRKLMSNEQFSTSLDTLRAFVDARRQYVLGYTTP